MLVIWLGALLVLGGLVFMMAQPIWRGRLSDATKRTSSGVPRDTLEPRGPGAGFTLKANWPGLVSVQAPSARSATKFDQVISSLEHAADRVFVADDEISWVSFVQQGLRGLEPAADVRRAAK